MKVMLSLEDFELRIGRHSENDVIIEDKSVSRFHARLFCKGNKYFIENVQGQNGIYVNGIKIYNTTRLDELDVVRLGGHLFNWKHYVRIQKTSIMQTKEFKISSEDIQTITPISELKKNPDGNKAKVDYFLVVLILFIVMIIVLILVI
jgi:pSer/pThr/pTyr-binding forkhead associated (FHA) protein